MENVETPFVNQNGLANLGSVLISTGEEDGQTDKNPDIKNSNL